MDADFVIVGAGSGGSAVAWRLAEAGHSVAVIEAGGSDAGPFIQMPGALSYPMNMARYDWGLSSEPEPALNNRRMATPRGKVIGGSSSVNGMVYVRGHARDFDHWAEQGAEGWAYADVLPYFKRMEHWHGAADAGGGQEWRGQGGPLHVTRGKRANPLFDAFIEAGRQAGYPVTRDYNGQQQEGFGAFEATIFRGERWSTAKAYLVTAKRLMRRIRDHVPYSQGDKMMLNSGGGCCRPIRLKAKLMLSACESTRRPNRAASNSTTFPSATRPASPSRTSLTPPACWRSAGPRW